MTKIFILTTFIIGFNFLNAQSPDSVYIEKFVDEMEGKEYLLTSNNLTFLNDSQNKGFTLTAFMTSGFDLTTVYVEMFGLGGCNENDVIIIQLENGETIKITSWKDFNCDGIAYFKFKNTEIEKLKSSPISKIRVKNGYSYESYTGEALPEQRRWFIQLFYAMDNKFFTLIEN